MISVRSEVLSIHLMGLPTFVLYENEIISYSSCLMFSGSEEGIHILFSLVWGQKIEIYEWSLCWSLRQLNLCVVLTGLASSSTSLPIKNTWESEENRLRISSVSYYNEIKFLLFIDMKKESTCRGKKDEQNIGFSNILFFLCSSHGLLSWS